MNPIERYYLHQAGRVYGDTDTDPVYSVPHFVQRGQGIGIFLTGFWRWTKPILWSGAKTLGRVSVRTGGRILADLAQNTNPDVTPRDLVSKHLSETVGKVLSGRGRKRKRNATTATVRNVRKATMRKNKALTKNKGYISIEDTYSLPDGACNETMFVSSEFDIFARKPVQESVLETIDVVYKPIASIDQSDLEFLNPADNETYIDPDI